MVGVLIMSALLLGVYIRAPDCWKLPNIDTKAKILSITGVPDACPHDTPSY